MPLAPGTRLGPYEIEAALGAGGMGEVYRARDTRLDRTVAIKILPARFSADAVHKQRFEREAKTISRLNHPHICVLHDIGHQDGIDYLVMECVEGETLAKRLEKGALPGEQVLQYGAQIADALDKAHRAGIVHRDLKPGNIMLTGSGVKLLDFGLAKPVVPLASAATLSAATPNLPVSEQGTIAGTFQYMSPEQIEGKELDGRSDIFSLGAVLYEMAAGRRAFEGKSQMSVASAILEKDPEPITAKQCTAPAALDHVIQTCLAKNPEERYQSAFDVKLELRWIAEQPKQVATVAAPRKQWRDWLASGVAAAALTLVATYFFAPQPAPGPPLMVSVVPPAGVFPDTLGRNGPPQISPDGSRLAFVGCKNAAVSASMAGGKLCSIWLRPLNSSDAREVAGTSGGYFPFWSPDGREIAFFADGKLKRVAADGGAVQILCDAEDARGGSWGSSGVIIFAATRGSPIFRVPAEGGKPEAVTRSGPVSNLGLAGSHRWAHFLPDGQHFLYTKTPTGACGDFTEVHFASLDGQQDVPLLRGCSSASYAAGRLVYWRDGNIVAQPFNPRSGVLSGTAAPIAEHVALDSLFAFGEFSASADGKLVYVAGETMGDAKLVWFDRTGKILGTIGQGEYKNVAISPNGSRVAANSLALDDNDVWVLDTRGTRTRLVFGDAQYDFPAWSADGRKIYFVSNLKEPFGIYVKAADSSGDVQAVVTSDKPQFATAFLAASPDGKYLAYVYLDPVSKLDIYTVPLTGDRKPLPFLHSAANESAPTFSPDGKWLAYESDQNGKSEVYVTAFPAGGAQYQVSTTGGERPVWRHDGKEIFYRAKLTMMAVEVDKKGNALEFGAPKPLFELAVRNLAGRFYDVSPDGRFLTNTSLPTTQSQNFELLVNWPAKLSR